MSPTAAATADRFSRHYGKYRGVVVSVEDPLRQGRVMAQVPDVLGATPTTWAMACLPFAGMQSGACFVPPVGSGVWIEFEQGDLNYPIWTGGWHGSATEVPPLAQAAPASIPHLVLQTTGQTCLMLSDVRGPTGGILLKTATGAMISINDTGITIANGLGASIVLTGDVVTVNQGALTVK